VLSPLPGFSVLLLLSAPSLPASQPTIASDNIATTPRLKMVLNTRFILFVIFYLFNTNTQANLCGQLA
jgi:hypothetical protein